MKKDLFLVIDMQNAYTKDGAWTCDNFDNAKVNILKIINHNKDLDIIFTKFVAPQSPIGTWIKYNKINQEVNESLFENEMIDDFKQYEVYEKSTYSCLSNKDVLQRCKEAKRVVVSGVVAECCVLSTVLSCIDEGIDVIYLTDAVAGINESLEQATISILKGLEYAQVSIMNTNKYLKGGNDETNI